MAGIIVASREGVAVVSATRQPMTSDLEKDMTSGMGLRPSVGSVSTKVAVLALTAGLVGCAHVKPDQLETELDRIRTEMAQGDEAVEGRLTGEMSQLESRMDGRLAGLEGAVEELEGEFRVTVERLESAVRFNTPVHFAFDEAALRSEDIPLLDRMAEILEGYYPDAVLTVEGFADPSGSRDYNLRLGQRRAEAVQDHLVGRGVDAQRIRAVSYGSAPERQIIAGAAGPGGEGWQNRRVAVVVDFGSAGPSPRVAGSSDGMD
ncbi:MAG: OmpA family protein [Gemmatimonadota bacterium]